MQTQEFTLYFQVSDRIHRCSQQACHLYRISVHTPVSLKQSSLSNFTVWYCIDQMNDGQQEIKEQERTETSLLRIQDIEIAQVNQLGSDLRWLKFSWDNLDPLAN